MISAMPSDITASGLRPHDLVEVADEQTYTSDNGEQHQCPKGCAQFECADYESTDEQRREEVVAIIDLEPGHRTTLAMNTKNNKGPRPIPTRKPNPIPWLIRLNKESGLLGMNSATAAGSPEKNRVEPPSMPAQASSPLTAAVPSEGLASQRTRMTAAPNMSGNISAAWDGDLR